MKPPVILQFTSLRPPVSQAPYGGPAELQVPVPAQVQWTSPGRQAGSALGAESRAQEGGRAALGAALGAAERDASELELLRRKGRGKESSEKTSVAKKAPVSPLRGELGYTAESHQKC